MLLRNKSYLKEALFSNLLIDKHAIPVIHSRTQSIKFQKQKTMLSYFLISCVCFLLLPTCSALITLPNCGISKAVRRRVVNGEDAEEGEFPWLVSLQYRVDDLPYLNYWQHFCSGSILNQRFIITAMHCIQLFDSFKGKGHNPVLSATFGGNSLSEMNKTSKRVGFEKIDRRGYFLIHPQKGDVGMIRADIALLKTLDDLPVGVEDGSVNGICLPEDNRLWIWGKSLVVAGWGVTDHGTVEPSDLLQKGKVITINNYDCNTLWRSYFWELHDKLFPGIISNKM